ncbi:hypothetical protein GH714_043277 [Hevea brasiliensis]|uniref:Uncharacterized protein n=1 Tax=Hevea brasiliensis TaxID=3981 RepID=A0A6A6K2E7_HEVBR|nr:hypothetical protein GH714_043277 [Hevea brasiliensis]
MLYPILPCVGHALGANLQHNENSTIGQISFQNHRIDDDPDRVCTSSPQLPIRNMVFNAKKDEIRGRGANKKLSRRNIYRNETQIPKHIVFCFKEDGAFDVVIDGKSEEPLKLFDSGNTSPRPVNRKLNYGKVAETVRKAAMGKCQMHIALMLASKLEKGLFLLKRYISSLNLIDCQVNLKSK